MAVLSNKYSENIVDAFDDYIIRNIGKHTGNARISINYCKNN